MYSSRYFHCITKLYKGFYKTVKICGYNLSPRSGLLWEDLYRPDGILELNSIFQYSNHMTDHSHSGFSLNFELFLLRNGLIFKISAHHFALGIQSFNNQNPFQLPRPTEPSKWILSEKLYEWNNCTDIILKVGEKSIVEQHCSKVLTVQ